MKLENYADKFGDPEKVTARAELREKSFDDRVQILRPSARKMLESNDNAFAIYASQLSSKFERMLPDEDTCEEITESVPGKKYFAEGPMVIATILEYRLKQKEG